MRFVRTILVVAVALLVAVAPAGAAAPSHSKKNATSHKSHRAAKKKPRTRGQQAIAPERVTEIQSALVKAHYLSKDPDGRWDDTTRAAMQKYQSDHGWQTKLMPDSRALVRLGLGPDYSDAINAKGSSFAAPPPESTIPVQEDAGFAAAAHVSQ